MTLINSVRFCEGGSLQSIAKKFGAFSANLCAVYTKQILNGLVYLHEQGVIHRDIKAANILSNRDGRVKLADFGVARRIVGFDEVAVVGSPYWMAPEIVQLAGSSTASDIWYSPN